MECCKLEEFFTTKLSVEYIENDGEDSKSELSISYNVLKNSNRGNVYRLDFNIKSRPKKGQSGLLINASASGFFSFSESAVEEDMQYLVRLNGGSILYGLLRGQIAMVSGSFSIGKFNLPTIIMEEVVQEIENNKEANNDKE